jgi:hypothetical protein
MELIDKQKVISVLLALSVLIGMGFSGCKANPSANTGSAAASSKTSGEDVAKLTLNAADSGKLPENFRIVSADDVKADREKNSKKPDLTGLQNLKMSGSAQFSQKELTAIINKIGKQQIVIFDLRQESHGFVNGDAVSYMNNNNNVNKGLSKEECQKRETQFLASLKIGSQIAYSAKSKPFTVNSVKTEEQLVKSAGLSYVRLYITDRERPSDGAVDDFLAAVKALPQSSWLHFHCMAGQGRTTTFMAMTDMMKNAKATSFDNILYRQYLLGGADLTAPNSVEDWQGRFDFLKKFYTYCAENKDGFKTTWSAWVKSY